MEEMIKQTYMIALPIVLTAMMGYIVWLLQNQKRERDANSHGTMLLLRVQIIDYHDKWTTRGYRTIHGTENIEEMYAAYHDLGGNGMVTALMDEIRELPIGNEKRGGKTNEAENE